MPWAFHNASASKAHKGCREAFSDYTNTIHACNVLISSPDIPAAQLIRALQVRAGAYLASRNPELAEQDYTSAIERLPKGQLQGYILYQRGQLRVTYLPKKREAGLVDLYQANALAPANTRILEALALAYLGQNNAKDALIYATQAVEIDPRSVIARKAIARAYQTQGKTHLVLKELNALLNLSPRDHDLLVWRGEINQKRNNIHAALADFRRAARIKSTDEILYRIRELEKLER